MRGIILLVIVMLITPAHADYAAESNRLKQKYDMATADEIMELTELQRKIIMDEAENIESQIEQINPDIVAKNKDRPVPTSPRLRRATPQHMRGTSSCQARTNGHRLSGPRGNKISVGG